MPCVVNGEPNYGQVDTFNALSVPMTYVEWVGLDGVVHSTYIVNPINISYPQIAEPAPGVMMRLAGVWVMTNGGARRFLNTTGVEVTPSSVPKVVIVRPSYSTYYLISITSIGQISVNGSLVSNYAGWVRAGSVINITATPNYLGNGTRLLPINGSSLLITVDKPMNITIGWIRQYLITVSSEYPINVNGSLTMNYVNWVTACSRLIVNADAHYLGNDTRYVVINGTGTYKVCSPMSITVDWAVQYLVVVTSPVPILINGVKTVNYTGWLTNGTSLVIIVPRYYYLGNSTRLIIESPG